LSIIIILVNTIYNLGYLIKNNKSILGYYSEASLGITEGSEALEKLFNAYIGLEAKGKGVGYYYLNTANYRRARDNRRRNKGTRSLSPRFRG
jgi:hypothetical protein